MGTAKRGRERADKTFKGYERIISNGTVKIKH